MPLVWSPGFSRRGVRRRAGGKIIGNLKTIEMRQCAHLLIVYCEKPGVLAKFSSAMTPSLQKLLPAPRLTNWRITLALLVAAGADGLQFLFAWLGPAEWLFIDPVIDTIAAALTCWLLGFHMLLLPTFVVKLVPLAEDLPTWTACVAAVIVLRQRAQRKAATNATAQIVTDQPEIPR